MMEFTEDKVCELYENVEKGLKYMGKAMQYLDEYKHNQEHERKREDDDYDDYEGRRKEMRLPRSRYDRYDRY